MNARAIAFCCVFAIGSAIGSLSASGQMPSSSTATLPAVGTIAAPSQAIDSQLGLIEGEMNSAVKAMPAEKFGFAPSASIFVPGQKTDFATVRTFAQQATHVAEANYFFYGIISGLKPDVDVSGIEKLTKKEDILAALAGSFSFAHKAIATLTAANAFEVIKSPEPGFQTRATLAAFGLAHAWDHYGQMVEYLRMNGVVPPASAK
jgi:uncharacterized damage-inducible protein DinB